MSNILRDYGALVAPVAAIINGFIAVLVAQFFKEHPVAKVVLVVMAGLLGSAAIGSTLYYQHQIVADKADEDARRKTTREGLGGFITAGNSLIAQIAENKTPIPQEAVDRWANSVESFLLDNLGNSYISRFRDATGIPYLIFNAAHDDAHQNLWFAVYTRVDRLEEFSRQLP